MPRFTQAEKFRTYLTAHGYVRDRDTRTRKYEVYTKPGEPMSMFIGKMGALRVGLLSTTSVPVSDANKARMSKWYDEQALLPDSTA